MKIIKKLIDFYKKDSRVRGIIWSLIIVVGLMFCWYVTVPLVIFIYLWKKFKKDKEIKKNTKKVCPHCKTEINWEASRCPNCHGKIYVWTSDKIIVAMILAVVIFIAFSGILSDKNSSTNNISPQEQAIKDPEIMSLVAAKEVIKGILKAPSTAEFVDVKAYELSNLKDVWAVNGYVDSQNSYGALIRNQWEVQLDYRDGKGGTVKSVLLEGEKLL